MFIKKLKIKMTCKKKKKRKKYLEFRKVCKGERTIEKGRERKRETEKERERERDIERAKNIRKKGRTGLEKE